MQYHPSRPVIVPEDKKFLGEKNWSYTLEDGSDWTIYAESISKNWPNWVISVYDPTELDSVRHLVYSGPTNYKSVADVTDAIKGVLSNIQSFRRATIEKLSSPRIDDYYGSDDLDDHVKALKNAFIHSRDVTHANIIEYVQNNKIEEAHAWDVGDGTDTVILVSPWEGHPRVSVGILNDEPNSKYLKDVFKTHKCACENDLPDVVTQLVSHMGDIYSEASPVLDKNSQEAAKALAKARADYVKAMERVNACKFAGSL